MVMVARLVSVGCGRSCSWYCLPERFVCVDETMSVRRRNTGKALAWVRTSTEYWRVDVMTTARLRDRDKILAKFPDVRFASCPRLEVYMSIEGFSLWLHVVSASGWRHGGSGGTLLFHGARFRALEMLRCFGGRS